MNLRAPYKRQGIFLKYALQPFEWLQSKGELRARRQKAQGRQKSLSVQEL